MTELCGTARFVAPEMLGSAYTNKADMWSLGVTFYMMLTKHPLFWGERKEMLKMIKDFRPGWCHEFFDLSEDAQDFVDGLITRDPSSRWSAAEALNRPWLNNPTWQHPAPVLEGVVRSLLRFPRASRLG